MIRRFLRRQGYVYVLQSLSKPGVVKIGSTSWSVQRRVEQLAQTPGYRGFAPFQIESVIWVPNCLLVEKLTHRRLWKRRIYLSRTRRRELFRARPEDAIDAVCECIDRGVGEREGEGGLPLLMAMCAVLTVLFVLFELARFL